MSGNQAFIESSRIMVAHLVLAIMMQLAFARLFRNWLAGAGVASAWATSRELTQAEYRWIEAYGGGLRANMPWWGGLDLKVWGSIDPWLDWMVPAVVVFAIAGFEQRRHRQMKLQRKRP